jgi:glycosyltransferase involved in cell wall biosynthesis
MSNDSVVLSIVIPCLNEEQTIETCIAAASSFLSRMQVSGEIIVADNGSTDRSVTLATTAGARCISVSEKGYGAALLGGLEVAKGEYIIFGDADASYDFEKLDDFLEKLRNGADVVVGSRFRGRIEPGAMPLLHRYLGTPVLTFIHRLLFGTRISDSQSGLRGVRREVLANLDLRTTGMEFASEMLVKAMLLKLKIEEVPINFKKDGRQRAPHLRPWRDGWRHLRFLLLYSPRWLFLYPGVNLILIGTFFMLWLLPGPRQLTSRIGLDVHTMLAAATFIIVGYQLILFGIFARTFAELEKLIPKSTALRRVFGVLTLERGILVGFVAILFGIFPLAISIRNWVESDFGAQDYTAGMRLMIPAVTFIILGFQTIFGSFLLSLLSLNRK